jgi:hypothetical protein
MGGAFGACPPDGTTDGNDRFHALNCFSNQDTSGIPGEQYPCEENPPSAYNVDAGGPFGDCDPDGVCDANDAFHALNTFEGSTTCSCDGPAPNGGGGPVVVASTSVLLQADQARVAPGGVVAVDAFLGGAVQDLRGYQLHVIARGSKQGTLSLIDISITGREDYVYSGLPAWQAFNARTGQMTSGLDGAGIAAPAGAYLATFLFQASPDAAGSFVVELLHDDTDPAQRTFLFPTLSQGKIAIETDAAAEIMVGKTGRARSARR